MIYTKGTRVWTPFGYRYADDLYMGEKVISFNPERGVCEYDTIEGIELEYTRCMGYGITSKSLRQHLTPDHPLLFWNDKEKKLTPKPIEDRFMYSMAPGRTTSILCHALFEPYKQTQDPEDIKWSARMAASIAWHKRAKLNVENIVNDLGGYEAQLWLDTFFHWNKMQKNSTWMATVKLNNLEVREAVLNIAPRAGVGAKWYMLKGKNVISISSNGEVAPMTVNGWFKYPIDGITFNLTTRNGNILIKSYNSTSLVACKKQGE